MGGGGSQSRLCSLVFAKVVQRRHGPKGTSGLLLRKEGWRASCFCYPQSGVPEASKQNTPPLLPRQPLWPGPFPLEFQLCSQLRAFFLPTSPPFSCLTPLGRPRLPSIGMWLGSHCPVAGWGPQPSAAGHKPLAPNWQLEAVGGVRSRGLGKKNPNRDLSWGSCGSQGWCSLTWC